MLKFLQVCFVILFPVNLFAQNAKTFSWKKPEYAVVKAYLYNCDSINYDSLLIINNGRLTAEIMPDSGKVLNATQINQVIVFINSEPKLVIPKKHFVLFRTMVSYFLMQMANPLQRCQFVLIVTRCIFILRQT